MINTCDMPQQAAGRKPIDAFHSKSMARLGQCPLGLDGISITDPTDILMPLGTCFNCFILQLRV